MAQKDETETAMTAVAVVFVAANFALEPYVVSRLWLWFVVPLGVAAITWSMAFGMNLIVNLWLLQWRPNSKGAESLQRASFHIFASLFAWGIGYLVLRLA